MSRAETVEKISDWIRSGPEKPKMAVTAYSEFYVTARKDQEFGRILRKADLVTPDGVSVLAAVEFVKKTAHDNILGKLAKGVGMTGRILSGSVGETVTGVWLFEELTKMAAKRGWKVFLLGGWGNVSGRTAEMLLKRFPDIKVAYDAGEERVGTDKRTDEMVVKKINAFKPDLLFVAYNPIKQEKWIASHLSFLKVGVALGIGGTFNEYLGDLRKAPRWMENVGLKWLWRVIIEPKRMGRILRAVVVFPWMVFVDSVT